MFEPNILINPIASSRIHTRRALDPRLTQTRALIKLVDKAKLTRFGVEHEFSRIKSVEDYQRAVPLRRYEDFWKRYWAQDFPVIIDASWPGQIPYFAKTSGTTTGTTKFIPVTKPILEQNRSAGLDVLAAHFDRHPDSTALSKKSFLLGGSITLEKLANGVFSGDVSGILRATIPPWLRLIAFPPDQIARETNWELKLDLLADAVARTPISVISGIPSWLIELFQRIDKKHEHWPLDQLELLIHGGINVAPYRQSLAPWLERSKATTLEVYPASEGFMAFEDAGPGQGMLVCFDGPIFFEFVPLSELDSASPRRLTLWQVETGVDYALVLTSAAGLWSYIIGDLVRFVSREPPRLIVSGRTSYMMSVFGEHVIADELERAIADAARALDIKIRDFSVGASLADASTSRAGHHVWLVEPVEPVDPSRQASLAEQFASRIDQCLIDMNEDYAAHRAVETAMTKPVVTLLAPGRFDAWLRAQNRLGNQHKIPRVVTDPERFQSMVDEIG